MCGCGGGCNQTVSKRAQSHLFGRIVANHATLLVEILIHNAMVNAFLVADAQLGSLK